MRSRTADIVAGAILVLYAPVATAKEKEAVKVLSPKSAVGVETVVVASFAVAFVTEKTDSAFAGSRLKGAGSVTKARLANFDQAQMQRIADAAYEDFVQRAGAAGIRVVDRSALLAAPRMAKVQFAPSGSSGTIGLGKDSKAKAAFVTPSDLGASGIAKADLGGGTLTGIGSMFSGFSSMGPAMARAYFASENKQPVVTVLIAIDFADAKHYGGRFAMASNVQLKASLAAVDVVSQMTVTTPKGQTTLTLAEPLGVPGDFGDLADSTTGRQKAENILGSAIAGLAGGSGTSYKQVTFTADPTAYAQGSTQAASQANQAFVDRLSLLAKGGR